jgi:hypothetical protein
MKIGSGSAKNNFQTGQLLQAAQTRQFTAQAAKFTLVNDRGCLSQSSMFQPFSHRIGGCEPGGRYRRGSRRTVGQHFRIGQGGAAVLVASTRSAINPGITATRE